MSKEKQELLYKIAQIEVQLSDLHHANKTGSFDMDGRKRTNLSEEWVILSRQFDKMS